MNQNLWGPHFWFTLHTLTFYYPLNPTSIDKKTYYTFIITFSNILPCNICKKNFKRKLNENPLENYLHSRKAFVYWMIDCHNKVNSETGKRYYSYNEIISLYEKKLNKKIILDNGIYKHNPPNRNYINLLILILLILILIILYNKYYN